MERRAIPGRHSGRRIGGVLSGVISFARDRVRVADQILASATRYGFAIGDNLPAGAAVFFALSKMLMTMGIGYAGSRGRSAAGKRPGCHDETHGASPSSTARIRVRFKARNA